MRSSSAGYCLPLWGELKTAGAVHTRGARISKYETDPLSAMIPVIID
jgi:hypothetical protein